MNGVEPSSATLSGDGGVWYGKRGKERGTMWMQRSNMSASRTCLEHGEIRGNEQRLVINKKSKRNCAEKNSLTHYSYVNRTIITKFLLSEYPYLY